MTNDIIEISSDSDNENWSVKKSGNLCDGNIGKSIVDLLSESDNESYSRKSQTSSSNIFDHIHVNNLLEKEEKIKPQLSKNNQQPDCKNESVYDLFLKGKLKMNESDIKDEKELRWFLRNCTTVAISKSKILRILLAILDNLKEEASESKCNRLEKSLEAPIPNDRHVQVSTASFDHSMHGFTN